MREASAVEELLNAKEGEHYQFKEAHIQLNANRTPIERQ